MSELRRSLIRVAADLPEGDETRRKLLAALSRNAMYNSTFIQATSFGAISFGATFGGFGSDGAPMVKLMPLLHKAIKNIEAAVKDYSAAMKKVYSQHQQRVNLDVGVVMVQVHRENIVVFAEVDGSNIGTNNGRTAYLFDDDEYPEEFVAAVTAAAETSWARYN